MLPPALCKMTRGIILLCAATALMIWPQQSMQAAREGLALCAQTIVPSLFVFFVLSNMVLKLDMARCLGRLLEPVMWPLFHVGGAGATAVVLGLVGGYPVGARTAMDLYREGVCSRTETERLLAFCNNSGPAFILGVVGAGVFGSGRAGLVLYGTHITASLCVGVLFRFYGKAERRKPKRLPVGETQVRVSGAFLDSVHGALFAVLNICAFVVVFAVVIRLLELSGVLNAAARGLTCVGLDMGQARQLLRGILEVSSGVSGLRGERKLAMAAFLLGWAGVCVHCQVLSFLADSGLRVGAYLVGKALHGVLSALLIVALDGVFPQFLPASGWVGQPMERVSGLAFAGTLALAIAAAWLVWMVFLTVAACGERNTKKRGRKGVPIAV